MVTTFTYLRNDNKHHQDETDDQIDPEEPPQEGEIRGHHRPEVGLYLLDTQLPGDQHVGCICGLPLQLLPFLVCRVINQIVLNYGMINIYYF